MKWRVHDILRLMRDLSGAKREYDKVSSALGEVRDSVTSGDSRLGRDVPGGTGAYPPRKPLWSSAQSQGTVSSCYPSGYNY